MLVGHIYGIGDISNMVVCHMDGVADQRKMFRCQMDEAGGNTCRYISMPYNIIVAC